MQRLLNSARVQVAQQRVLEWLTTGMTPRRLAFTVALGFALGCIPLVGVTTVICALAALLLRLNMPAIQAANWLAMPLQLVLLYPFLRLGEWLFPGQKLSFSQQELMAHLEVAPWHVLAQVGDMLGHAVLAWVITAGPALVLMTVLLTPLMGRLSTRISNLAAAEIK